MQQADERVGSWEITMTSSDVALIQSLAKPPPELQIEIDSPGPLGAVEVANEVIGILQNVGYNVLGSLIAMWIAQAAAKRRSGESVAGTLHLSMYEVDSGRVIDVDVDVDHGEQADHKIDAALHDMDPGE